MRRLQTVLAALVGLLAAVPARADFLYSFDQSVYTVAAGSTADINVYLKATGADVSALTTDGLISAGVQVTFPDPGPARVLSTLDISGNPAFDAGATPSLATGSAGLTEAVGIVSPPVTAPGGPSQSSVEVLLGTFTFTAGAGAGGQSATITATNFDYPPNIYNVTNFGLLLDPDITNGTATINVITSVTSAAPEPSSLILLVLGGSILASRGWRRRGREV